MKLSRPLITKKIADGPAGEFNCHRFSADDCTPQALADAVLQWLDDMDHQPAKMAALHQRFMALHHSLQRDTSQLATDAIEKILAG